MRAPRECAVCKQIAREHEIYDHRLEDWAQLKLLEPDIPHDAEGRPEEVDGWSLRCPECDNRYRYDRSGEHDDGTYWLTTRLRRLSFAERLASGDAPEAELAARQAAWRQACADPSAWLQREAAWELCCLAAQRGRWDEILELMGSAEIGARTQAVEFAFGFADQARVPPAAFERMAALASDESAACRRIAVTITATRRCAAGEHDRVLDELCADDEPVRIAARLAVLQRALDPATLAACHRIVPLLRHAAVGTTATSVVRRCLERGWGSPELLPALLALGRDADEPRVAKAVLTALAGLRAPCEDALPLLARWRDDRDLRFTVLTVLQAQARAGAALDAFLPWLAERMAARDHAEPSKVLLALLPSAKDKVPVVRAMLPGIRGSWALSLSLAIAAAVDEGHLGALLPEMRAAADGANDHFTGALARLEARRA